MPGSARCFTTLTADINGLLPYPVHGCFLQVTKIMESINKLSWGPFIERFGNVVEHGPIVAGAIWSQRPFADARDMHRAVCYFLDSLPAAGKKSILRCYPDIAGRLAKADHLTAESKREHRSAGLLALTQDEAETISQMNAGYREKFQFPFVICARENKKEAIMEGLKVRTRNSRNVEVENGVNEVKKIAWHRIVDLVPVESHTEMAKY